MPLEAILNRLSSTAGFDLATRSRNFVVTQIINVAAKRLYEQYSLRNANREMIVNIGSNQQQVVMPWYCDVVIAARDYDCRQPITQQDMRPRYQSSDWLGLNFNSWRQKQREYPLQKEILNASLLTLTFDAAVTSVTAVTITGSTVTAENEIETVTFIAGDISKATTKSFQEIRSIQKTANTNSNLRVFDIDNNELAFVPNFAERSKYVLLQVQDRWQAIQPERLLEVLFRPLYRPMHANTDVFNCGDIYDDAIYLESLAVHYGRSDDQETIALAATYHRAAEEAINNIAGQDDDSKKMTLTIASNGVYNAFDNMPYYDIYNNNKPLNSYYGGLPPF